jgi:hypothetical protein
MSLKSVVKKWLLSKRPGRKLARSSRETVSWQPSIARDMERLAARAWSRRGTPRDRRFLLDPQTLPTPHNAEDLECCLELLYRHARDWAAGFEVPFKKPKVLLSYLTDTPGVYAVDSDGYVSIKVSPALSAILVPLFPFSLTKRATTFWTSAVSIHIILESMSP